MNSQESAPAKVREGINTSVLCLLYGPALTTVRDHWEDHSRDYMDICQQTEVSAFQHIVYVCHSFLAEKQSPSDFMATVTIHSDFRDQKEEIFTVSPFSPSICHEVMGLDAMIFSSVQFRSVS